MKENGKKLLLAAIFVVIITALLSGCRLFEKVPPVPLKPVDEKISVILDLGGGEKVSPDDFISAAGRLVKPKKDPERTNFEFDGWYSDSERTRPLEFDSKITSDLTIYAKWVFEAAFILGDGRKNITSCAKDGDTVSPPSPSPSREGYSFEGWYSDEDLKKPADFETPPSGNCSFYAKWEPVGYSIYYNVDLVDVDLVVEMPPESPSEYTLENAKDCPLPSPTIVGDEYEFIGWFDADGNKIETLNGKSGDVSLYARYVGKLNALTLREAAAGEIVPAADNGGNDKIILGAVFGTTEINLSDVLAVPPGAALNVEKGDNESVVVSPGENSFLVEVTSQKGETKTYALEIKVYEERDAFITYKCDEETVFSEGHYPIGGKITFPSPAPKKPGYMFSGWYKDAELSEKCDAHKILDADITLYAKFVSDEFPVRYYLGIGKNDPKNPEKFEFKNSGTTVFYDPVPAAGYNFEGWYKDAARSVRICGGSKEGQKLLSLAEWEIDAAGAAFYAGYERQTKNPTIEGNFEKDGEVYKVSEGELKDFLSWVVYNRENGVKFKIYNGETAVTGDDIKVAVSKAYGEIAVPHFGGSNLEYSFEPGTGLIDLNKMSYSDPSEFVSAEAPDYERYGNFWHVPKGEDRPEDFEDFPINSILTSAQATTSEELVYVVESGYKPNVSDSDAAGRLYGKAKKVLRGIIKVGMTDFEKIREIYDYLTGEITYDDELLALACDGASPDPPLNEYDGFYLEGVFDKKKAVCDGISKAFMLMARIEGIECVRESKAGENNAPGHAWNKVAIDGEWYVCDATKGAVIIKPSEGSADKPAQMLSHRQFMLTDDEKKALGDLGEQHADKKAETSYNFFGKEKFSWDKEEYDFIIDSKDELEILMKAFQALTEKRPGVKQTAEFKMVENTKKNLETWLGEILSDLGIETSATSDEGDIISVIL